MQPARNDRPVRRKNLSLRGSLAALILLLAACQAAGADTITLPASKDNTLYQDLDGALSDGAGPTLFAGVTNIGEIRRCLLAFDLSAVPAGAVITGATLTLNMSRTISGAVTVTLHTVTADWGEGSSDAGIDGGRGAASATNDATWIHTFYKTKFWTNPGGDFVSADSASRSVSGVGAYTWGSTAQMVADVQGWVDSPSTNFGWVLICDETVFGGAKRFDSRSHPTDANRPRLTLDFTPAANVSGTVTLRGCLNLAQTLTFELRSTDGGSFTRIVTLAADGSFSLTAIPRGSYNLAIKGVKWLRKVVAVDASGGDVSGVTATLLPGDVNNDNRVNITDLGLLADTFGRSLGQTGYNASADLNADDKVTISDLGLLADSFGKQGDP
jgi:hypothetical protein